MELKTERLHLHPVREQDLEDLFRIYGDPAINTFNPAGPYPDICHAKNVLPRWLHHWSQYEFGCWAITEKDAPAKIIGFGGISIRNYGAIIVNNLGYSFATHARGKGYNTGVTRPPSSRCALLSLSISLCI